MAHPSTTRQWREYLTASAPQQPDTPTDTQWRDRYNPARTAYTRPDEPSRRSEMNRHQPSGARRSTMIYGPVARGTSTLVQLLASGLEG